MSKAIAHFTNGETRIIEDVIEYHTGYLKSVKYVADLSGSPFISIITKDNEYLFPYTSILYVEFERKERKKLEFVKEYH